MGVEVHGCANLTAMKIPEGMHLGEKAFGNCTGLTELDIPNGVSLGEHAFGSCTGLMRVKLPVDQAYEDVFFDTCNVTEIEYTPGVTGKMTDRFYGQDDNGDDLNSRTLEWYSSNKLEKVIFDEGVTYIWECAYSVFGNDYANGSYCNRHVVLKVCHFHNQ